jgi:hypothetical protein
MKYKFNYIYHGDKMFLIHRIIKESHFPNINIWKDHLDSDIILKKNGRFYFCEEVTDLKENNIE